MCVHATSSEHNKMPLFEYTIQGRRIFKFIILLSAVGFSIIWKAFVTHLSL